MSLFSFFRPKAPTPVQAAPTFNERVDAFWQWFAQAAPRFYATIEDKRCSDLTDETSAKVDEFLPEFAWVYGPGEGGVGHSFTLSGEGVEHKQLLALHWLARAPKIDGWTFYASRQGGAIKGIAINTSGIRFGANEIWVTPQIDAEGECIDLSFWHPAWDKLDDREKYRVAFLFLDEALGEYGTGWWIGRIDFGNERLADSFPLEELAEHIRSTAEAEGWKKYPPGVGMSLLRFHDIGRKFPRSDTFSQVTAVSSLIRDYFEADGRLSDPLAGSGAEYIYVSMPNSILPKGGEVEKRGAYEDALDESLRAGGLGRCIGGAIGRERVYVDLLLYDGARSLDAVRRTLGKLGAPGGTAIEYFAESKQRLRVRL